MASLTTFPTDLLHTLTTVSVFFGVFLVGVVLFDRVTRA